MSVARRTVHLVGIGGMHMSAIAQILLADGVPVSGSDLVLTPLTARLQALGARVYRGHAEVNVGEAVMVVTTAAAKPDNPELIEAARRGIPILQRHEMVARLMQERVAVAVAGTHGKTTTSTLIAFVLSRAGRNPTYLLGGESPDLGGNAAAGEGREIVVEADEYAGAFLAYHPQVAVVTNIEADHLDFYGSEERLHGAFRQFMENVPDDGLIVAGADSPSLRTIAASGGPLPASVVWYGLEEGDWRAERVLLHAGGGATFWIGSPEGGRGPFRLRLPGRHNVSNALAACAAVRRLGVDWEVFRDALADFRGAHRRFEIAGEAGGVLVVDDYAHHPTEVRATIAAARSRYPGRRVVVLFQPHTYTRTQYLLEGFRHCFAEADRTVLLQTFAARETPEAGIDAHDLSRELGGVPVADSLDEAVSMLVAELQPGDVCFTMGAGDVTKVGTPLLGALARR
jgi:UDP-N-acetylmuramate--alanine ligase